MPELAHILRTLDSAVGQVAALATLVRVEGSSYRRPGARLLLLQDGTRVGSISGGCLEEDVLERARRVLDSSKPELAHYDTTNENDLVWGVGFGCQGVVHIFIEPLPAVRPAWIEVLKENLRDRRETTLVVVYSGSDELRTRLIGENDRNPDSSETHDLLSEGRAQPPGAPAGARGGPSGPAPPKSQTLQSAASGPSGKFRQTITAPPALAVFGAGEDARPLVRLAKEVGWHVTVADARAGYGTAARFPEADRVLVAPAAEAARSLASNGTGFAVIMTHRYAEDLQLLRQLLPHPLAYLGLLGPRKRTDRLLTQLRTEGFSPDEAMLARLHAPIGLDLGGNTPETVALAIVAQIQCRLSGREPIHLRDRAAPIHG